MAEYLIDLNATQAAIRTGYSAKTAASQGARLLKQSGVARAVQTAQQARAVRTEITQDRVLQELARIAFFDIRRLYRADGSMKDPCELDADTAAALASIEVKEELERGGGEDALHEPSASAAVSATVSASASSALAHGGASRRRRGEQVAGYTIKTRVFDKVATLQLAMRHLGMLNDKLGGASSMGSMPAGLSVGAGYSGAAAGGGSGGLLSSSNLKSANDLASLAARTGVLGSNPAPPQAQSAGIPARQADFTGLLSAGRTNQLSGAEKLMAQRAARRG